MNDIIKLSSNCNLCKSEELEFLFSNCDRGYSESKRSFNLFKCKNCGLIFIDPQPSSDQLSDHYPDDYYSITEEIKITHLRKAFTLIQIFYQLCRIRSDESPFFRLMNYLFYPINSIFIKMEK